MKKRTLAIALVASVVLGVGAYAWAQTQPPRPAFAGAQQFQEIQQTQQGPSTQAPTGGRRGAFRRGHRLGGGILGRAVHGDLVVRTANGFENVSFDKGTVTSVTTTQIVLHRADGKDVTLAIDAATRFRGVQGTSAIQTGKPAVALSKNGTATLIGQRPATAGSGRANGNFGAPSSVDQGEEQVPAA